MGRQAYSTLPRVLYYEGISAAVIKYNVTYWENIENTGYKNLLTSESNRKV